MKPLTKSKLKPSIMLAAMALALSGALSACDNASDSNSGNQEVSETGDYERGPNNGRMLRDGDFALEITIYETGTPPQFRVYPYLNNAPVDAATVSLTMELGRHDGQIDRFRFQANQDYLSSPTVVTEPHSFDVNVTALRANQNYSWDYASYEGRTTISQAAADAANVRTEPVGPATIKETLDVIGRVDFAPDASAILRARFDGLVTHVYKSVGEKVRSGEPLAQIENNQSLRSYQVISPIDGVVMERFTNVGDVAGDDPLFVVADLTNLIVDFHVFPKDLHRVALGQVSQVASVDDRLVSEAVISTFLPTKELETQTVIARAPLSNPDQTWMPGMTVRGDIVVGEEEVALAVRPEAIQRFRDFDVVFAKVGDTYEVRMLELGRMTPDWVEVLGGIKPGQAYVTQNSFLIRADIEKSGASHDH